MKEILIQLDKHMQLDELKKVIGFVTEKIAEVKEQKDGFILMVQDDVDIKELEENVNELAKKYISVGTDEILYEKPQDNRKYYSLNAMEDVVFFSDGQIGFQGKAYFLYQYFDKVFADIAHSIGATDKRYPAMLPTIQYKKTGYLKNSPQYMMLCSSAVEELNLLGKVNDLIDSNEIIELLKKPEYALSPSACFHTYIEYENKVLSKEQVVTFEQNVFRNEGRFNFKECGRLRDYHVRETVFIGSEEFVRDRRQKMLDLTIKFLKKLNLVSNVSVAADPFIIPKMQTFKKIQKLEKSKYEIHINNSVKHKISTASFNFHGTAFTQPFNIKVAGESLTVTGCVGFGLERWVIAFLSQYGYNVNEWPEIVKNNYEKER